MAVVPEDPEPLICPMCRARFATIDVLIALGRRSRQCAECYKGHEAALLLLARYERGAVTYASPGREWVPKVPPEPEQGRLF